MNPTNIFFALLLIFSSAKAQHPHTFKLHAHNDYKSHVPFWEAYASQCASIEIDILLRKGELLVAHESETSHPARTLKSMYIDAIISAGNLNLAPPLNFQLLIDLKTDAYKTLEVLVRQLEAHKTYWYSRENPEGIKIVISGNQPHVKDYNKYPDYIFFDYQDRSLSADLPWDKIALCSFDFKDFSVWNGKGRMTEAQKKKVQTMIDKVHQHHKPIRFWGSPDNKTAWKAFYDMEVDYINTDQPFLANTYLGGLAGREYQHHDKHDIYAPTFQSDGKHLPVRNIILMIGDGNGLSQISAGMYANGNELNLTQLKNIGLIKTQSADDFTTDSAAGGTAIATGKKTRNRAVGVGPDGTKTENLPEILNRYGFSSGVITSDNMTGATPAAFYAHRDDRGVTNGIAADLQTSPLNLFIGYGERDFLSYGINRLDSLRKHGFDIVETMEAVSKSKSKKVGWFAPDMDPSQGTMADNFLPQATAQALNYFKKGGEPFFLMIEASKIDVGGHWNDSKTIIKEELNFDKAIGEVLRFVDENPNTLLIITADHETGGVSIPQGNISEGRVELDYQSYDHTGTMVPLFAYGTHAGDFRGVYENNKIFDKIMQVVRRYHALN